MSEDAKLMIAFLATISVCVFSVSSCLKSVDTIGGFQRLQLECIKHRGDWKDGRCSFAEKRP